MILPIALRILAGALLAASWAYLALAAAAVLRWRRSSASPASDAGLPPVTILKPVRGADPDQEACFRSFLDLDYPAYHLVFGALDPADPALDTVRRLQVEHPGADITIVAGGDAFGLNRKACNLHQMLPAACHDLIALCDSDMRVERDYLRRVVAPFADPRVGLVTCLYRGDGVRGLAAALEAVGIGADFAPSVLVANMTEGMSFAFGATIALHRDTLEAIGGFAGLANSIADDYLLGRRVHDLGRTVAIADCVIDDMIGRVGFREMWSRRVRWARTVRSMRPGGYAGSGVLYATPIAALFAAAMGGGAVGLGALAATVIARAALALLVASRTGDRTLRRCIALLPLADLVSLCVWAAGLAGSTVEWRGERFTLRAGGELEPVRKS